MASSPNTELLKVDLDTAAAEARVRNLLALIGQLATADPKKQDTSGLVNKINGEIESISNSTGKTKEAQSAIDAVIKSKEKLGSVVAILGGQFGGFIGQLGNVAQLFMTLGTAAVLPAAVLAAVTLFAKLWHDASEEVKKTREEAEKLAAVEERRRQAGKGEQQSIAEVARSFGVSGIAEAAADRSKQLQGGGLRSDMADFQAVMELGLGLDPDQAAAAMRGKLLGGEASGTMDPVERARRLRRLQHIGNRPGAVEFEQGFRRDTGEAARSGSYEKATRDVTQTNYAGALEKFIVENNLSPGVANEMRKALRTGESEPPPGVGHFLYKLGGGTESDQYLGQRAAHDFRQQGLDRSELPPEPAQRVVVQQTIIGTVYAGGNNVHAIPTSSSPQRAPGAASISRTP